MKKIILMALVFTLLFSGCTVHYLTKKLWQDNYKEINYDETIDALMMNPEDDSMIFIGEKYHYIFQPDQTLSYLLKHRDEQAMVFEVEQGNYEVKEDNATAFFRVYIDSKIATQEVVEWANKNGYNKHNKSEEDKIIVAVWMKGKRYIADPAVNKAVEKLSKQYHIQVAEKHLDNMNNAARIALTPLTVAVDSVQVAGSIVPLVVVSGIAIGVMTPLFILSNALKK